MAGVLGALVVDGRPLRGHFCIGAKRIGGRTRLEIPRCWGPAVADDGHGSYPRALAAEHEESSVVLGGQSNCPMPVRNSFLLHCGHLADPRQPPGNVLAGPWVRIFFRIGDEQRLGAADRNPALAYLYELGC